MKDTMQAWSDRIPTDRLENDFTDYKTAYTDSEARAEALRCLNCYEAPCIRACPTQINIPQFIGRIGTGNLRGSAKTILESNIFGLSCAQACPTEVLCEGACVYNRLGAKPISIGKLQRHAVTQAYQAGWEYFEPGPDTGKRVALVGAGPASLACAHELRRQGHQTVVFEKASLPGGLNTSGIAPYKMKAWTSLQEIEKILKMGIEIRYGQELGRDFSLEGLTREFDAVFLGVGLGGDRQLGIPGEENPAIQGAVEWIARLKTAPRQELAQLSRIRTALVIGGGNTAMDACRELQGLKVPEVWVSYRRGEAEMSGYEHEYRAARQAGVGFHFHTTPIRFESAGERVRAVLQGKEDALSVEADLVLLAAGQEHQQALLAGISELHFDSGRLVTDPTTGATGHPKVFAGGDLANGAKEVVNAVAEGKRAAQGIHQLLTGAQK